MSVDYYKLRVQHTHFGGKLTALVSFNNSWHSRIYPLFNVIHIITNWIFPDIVLVGDACYSIWITSPPKTRIRTVIHDWVREGVEIYREGIGLNAELKPIPEEVAQLVMEKASCEAHIQEISEELGDYDMSF